MNIKKHLIVVLVLLTSFLMLPCANANVWVGTVSNPIPSGALTDNGSKVNICHRKGNGGYVKINISINGLKGHNDHTASGEKLADQFFLEGKCLGSSEPPELCADNQILTNKNECETCPTGLVADDSGEQCVTPPPSCTGGQILNETQDNCVCPTGKVLINGICTVTCPAGQTLINNVCTIICPTGESLVNGICTSNCPTGQEFVNGACACPVGKTLVNGTCQSDLPSQLTEPTVNSLKTSIVKPTITGTAGNNTSLTISLAKKSKEGESYTTVIEAISVGITENGAWSFTPETALKAGVYDVIATGNQAVDKTKDELEIAIDICDMDATPHDQVISIDEWEGERESATYYLGKCVAPVSSEPLPLSPTAAAEKLPDYVQPLTNQFKPVIGLEYCEDGGVKSDTDITGAIIKRAIIINASTEGGIIDLLGMPTKIKYGIKAPAIGTMDISSATIIGGNKAVGATLTGVTIDDVYIDTSSDYINASGQRINGGTYIAVAGGITKPTTIKEDNSITNATMTSGVITEGKDFTGNPVRGTLTSGTYNIDITNSNTVLTQGRRVRGKIVNATIENAQTTSVNGVTVIDSGIVKAGEMQAGSTSPVSTFGTVMNATLSNVTISNTNHCFSSGSVGSRGLLNWKEVVK